MDEHADPGAGERDLLERIALAAVGALALTGERLEAFARELADRGTLRREDARSTLDGAAQRWRGDATRLSERAGENLRGVFRELGLVTRAEVDELELRVAQLEHRLRLLEGGGSTVPPPLAPRG